MRVLFVCMGDAADPVTSWCRWGGSDQDWYRLGLDPDGTPPRFRRRGRSMTREQRAGLRSDGWRWDGAAWALGPHAPRATYGTGPEDKP